MFDNKNLIDYLRSVKYILPIFLLFFLLSFYRVAGSIPTLLIILSFIVYLFKNKPISFRLQNYSLLILFSIYFFVSFLSLVFFENKDETIVRLQLKITIIIVPFLLIFFIEKYKHLIRTILYFSIIGNIISFLLIITNAILKYSSIGIAAFQYTELMNDFLLNPIYYSAILNINIISVFYLFKSKNIKIFIIKYLVILLLAIGVILSASKMGIIVLAVNLIILIYSEFLNNKKYGLSLLIPIITVLLFLNINNKLDNVFKRFYSIQYYLQKRENPNMNQRFPRIIIWESSFEVIKQNFFIGVGIANTNNELLKEYTKIGFGKGIKDKFNSHNQFIETFLASGVFGFISLILIFVYLFKIAFKNKDKHFLHFLFIITFYFLIESFLKNQMGMYIFVMFSSLFILNNTLKLEDK